jgi:hypothetical protein
MLCTSYAPACAQKGAASRLSRLYVMADNQSVQKDGPGTRAANSDRALTPEVQSEAYMSMTPHPCDVPPGDH